MTAISDIVVTLENTLSGYDVLPEFIAGNGSTRPYVYLAVKRTPVTKDIDFV